MWYNITYIMNKVTYNRNDYTRVVIQCKYNGEKIQCHSQI